MSKIVKKVAGAVKDVVSGVGKAVKKVFEGVKKVFKKVWESSIGKVIIIAAAIYFGGAAFGLWQTPFASVNGAFVGGAQATASTGAAAGAGGAGATAGAAADPLAAKVAADAAAGGAAASAPSGASAAAAAMEAPTVAGGAVDPLIAKAAAMQAPQGIIGKAIAGVKEVAKWGSTWANEHPFLAAQVAGGIANAATETEAETARKMEQDRLRRFEQNLAVGGLDTTLFGRAGSSTSDAPAAPTPAQQVIAAQQRGSAPQVPQIQPAQAYQPTVVPQIVDRNQPAAGAPTTQVDEPAYNPIQGIIASRLGLRAVEPQRVV